MTKPDFHGDLRALQARVNETVDVAPRRKLVADLAATQKREPVPASMRQERVRLGEKLGNAARAHREAATDFYAIDREIHRLEHERDRAIALIEAELRRTAPRDLFDLRLQLDVYDCARKYDRGEEMTIPQLRDLLGVVRGAIKHIDDVLVLAALDDEELSREIAKIEAAIQAAGGDFKFKPDRRSAM